MTARLWLSVAAGLVLAQAAILLAMGQPAVCACGHLALWTGEVSGPENSQQVADWYTPSHVIHGFVFYALARWAAPRAPLPARLVLAVLLEAAWEVVENSPPVIARYRRQALAQGYAGDSVLNSACDTLAMIAGFLLARALPVGATFGLALLLEAWVGWAIRDNLTLNVIQLIHPVEAVSRWQTGR